MNSDSKDISNISRRTVLSNSIAAPLLGASAYYSASSAGAAECAPKGAIGGSLGDTRVTRVVTTYGPVRGLINESIHTFKGIRYGRPPVGKGRFKAPEPPEPWTAMFDATNFGPVSPQTPLASRSTLDQARHASYLALNSGFMGMPAMEPDQSEDCLVLNVWTPGVGDGRKRAVMFRIHGGGYFAGSGAWSWHDGTNMARRGDVVVVTMNHRLTPLGYLYLADAMGPDFAAGNAGMMDLVLALTWVRDNIAAFGGDPGNVTIFGESGGGNKVSTLLAMPPAAGLFHHAIIQSGAAMKSTPREAAIEQTDLFLKKAGVAHGDIEKLQSLSVEALFDAMDAAQISPAPCVDGVTLLDHPGDAIAKGMSSHIPLMVGATLHEWATIHSLSPELAKIKTLSEADLKTSVTKAYGTHADGLIKAYRKSFPHVTPGEMFLIIEAGGSFRRGAWTFAENKLAKSEAPVYMYLLEWKSGAMDGMIMAGHGLCVPLTMDNTERTGSWTADYPDSGIVAAAMSESWIAFGKSGNPSAKGYAEWTAYDTKSRDTMVFNVTSKLVSNPHGEHDIWNGIPQAPGGIFSVPGVTLPGDSPLERVLHPHPKT